MKDQLFVIAIGGTGMRCLESFVHLCAIGMFDNEEINILTLDTDQGNGNKARVENLIDLYRKVKSDDSQQVDGGDKNTNTFFSAKLNLYKFFTNYSNDNANTYQKLSNVSTASVEQREEDKELSDLFFQDDTVQTFKSPHRPIVRLSNLPLRERMVSKSVNVWVGCWCPPSPALITGIRDFCDATSAAPSFG